MSGANVSMSGHMTITSRGSSDGSSCEEVEDRVAQDLDLAGAPVAGVDLEAAVAGLEQRARVRFGAERQRGRRSVGAHVGLDAGEQRVGVVRDRVVVVDRLGRRAGEDELHLARVAPPRGEQAVLRDGRAGVVGAEDDRGHAGELVPQRRRRVQEEQVHVAMRGERREDVAVRGRQPGEAEQREALGQVDDLGLGPQPGARRLEALGGPRRADPLAQAPPELRLPVPVRARPPTRARRRAGAARSCRTGR